MDRRVPRPSQRDAAKAATRAALIAAATALFNSRGYDAVTIRTICAKAKVSTGSLFGNFSGKQALWEACAGLRMPTPGEWACAVAALEESMTISPDPQAAATVVARAKL